MSTFEHDVSAHVVSGRKQHTYGRNYARNFIVVVYASTSGCRSRYWKCNYLTHTRRECKNKAGGK